MTRDLKRRLDRLDSHRGQHTTILVKYVEPEGTVADGYVIEMLPDGTRRWFEGLPDDAIPQEPTPPD